MPLDLTNVACVGASSALLVAEAVVAYKTARGRIPAGRGVLALLAIGRAQSLLLTYARHRLRDSYGERQHEIAEKLRGLARARESERLFRSPTIVPFGPCSIHRERVETDGVCRVCRYKNRSTGGAYLARYGFAREHDAARASAEVDAVVRAVSDQITRAPRPQPKADGTL